MVQIGATRSVATLLQRVGRSGHALARVPKGRIFPLAIDELVEAAALLRCVREGLLDRTASPPRPLDILAQQIVAECVPNPCDEDVLFERFRRAQPYADLPRAEFDEVVRLHAENGRRALLHRDGVNRRLHATKRARLTALQSGGAIPDTADYQVRLEPEGTLVGTVNEDWAIESNGGDIFQLGNMSWRILRVEPGVVRVADAKGQPPSIPFWLGEGPGRTRELSGALADIREACTVAADRAEAEGTPGIAGAVAYLRDACGPGFGEPAALQLAEYVLAGRKALGCVPTQRRVVLERFFDEAGGTQLVVHAPFGSRINRAWGLALRKKFCVGFGFELQAAANEEAIVLSLGPQHSFPLAEVFGYLHPTTARDVLIQALLPAPMFGTRWRWNAQRSLLLERARNGKARAGGAAAHARGGPAGRRVPRGARLPGDAARRPARGARGPPDRAPDDRGLPDGGHGRRRLPRDRARPRRTGRSRSARSTRPSRPPSRAGSSRASRTPSSTTRRSRSGGRRP